MSDYRDRAPAVRVGISSCLLGEGVRFDGGHKRNEFLVDILGSHVEWVPVCPEVELGLGIPRPSIRLVQVDTGVRIIVPETGRDLTMEMKQFARRRAAQLEQEDLSGYVLKKDSPSCGMERVKVYGPSGMPSKAGRGLFAEELIQHFPGLPVEEEGRLSDHRLRENFIERVFAYRRLKSLFEGRWSMALLIRFHTEHKLILMAHSPKAYSRLGQLVARGKSSPPAVLRRRYSEEFMQALRHMATPGRHANVLMHMLGYFKDSLDPRSRAELLQLIEDYRAGLVPLIVPVTLIRHHARRAGEKYLLSQLYLEPHPKELMLRNHV